MLEADAGRMAVKWPGFATVLVTVRQRWIGFALTLVGSAVTAWWIFHLGTGMPPSARHAVPVLLTGVAFLLTGLAQLLASAKAS